MFFLIRSAMRQSTLPRSLADILRHGPATSSKALRAAATAWSTSCAPASVIWVSTSPVAGLKVSKDRFDSDHCPLISSLPGETFALVAVIIFIPVAALQTAADSRMGLVWPARCAARGGTAVTPPPPLVCL